MLPFLHHKPHSSNWSFKCIPSVYASKLTTKYAFSNIEEIIEMTEKNIFEGLFPDASGLKRKGFDPEELIYGSGKQGD
jgi:hypothetical protein